MGRFLLYIQVGLLCAAIDIGVMMLAIWIGAHELLAATIGFGTGFLVNLALHTKLTFAASWSRAIVVRFSAVVALNYLLTLFMIWLAHMFIGSALAGKVASLPLIALTGYTLSKRWVFR